MLHRFFMAGAWNGPQPTRNMQVSDLLIEIQGEVLYQMVPFFAPIYLVFKSYKMHGE